MASIARAGMSVLRPKGGLPGSDIDALSDSFSLAHGESMRAPVKGVKGGAVKLQLDNPRAVHCKGDEILEYDKARAKRHQRQEAKKDRPRYHRFGRAYKARRVAPEVCCDKRIEEFVLRITSAPTPSRLISPLPIG